MGYKTSDGILNDSCLDKIKPDEWFFVMRGQDITSTIFVRLWIWVQTIFGTCPNAKLDEATNCVLMMERTENRKLPD